MNGGSGADRFFHTGLRDHGSDWIQDFSTEKWDVLNFGGIATLDQFEVHYANPEGSGSEDTSEAFVLFLPTSGILWALVDGQNLQEIILLMGGEVFDLLA